MYLKVFLAFLIICQFTCNVTATKEETIEEPFDFDPTTPYCFQFTWLGPNYDNVSTPNLNISCNELIDPNSLKSEHIPCHPPLVITDTANPPNLTYLYENFRNSVLKRPRNGEACVKYSYTLNKALQNVTYMRSKVFAYDEGAVYSGCYIQMIGGTEVELCVCKPRVGYMPCNFAITKYPISLTLILFMISNLYVL